jgi:hypothetical protein
MDLETFLTTLYVLVDNWYKAYIVVRKPHKGGPVPDMTDSEVLTLAIAGQWRIGVPWSSERGLVRYINAHCRDMFPTMLQRSAFNYRVRRLWGAFILLQQIVADELGSLDDLFMTGDCVPVPAFSRGQAQRGRGHWLWESTLGHGGTSGWYYGDKLLAIVSPNGVVTGWILGSAYMQDRWLLEALLSARMGHPQLQSPTHDTHQSYSGRPVAPSGHIGPFQAVGKHTHLPYLFDKGFSGTLWQTHWREDYHVDIIAAPIRSSNQPWPIVWEKWLASHRQIVETAFAWLNGVFGLNALNAHSRWGQYTRLAAKVAAYNIGLFINRLLGRPLGALETLIC